MRKKEIGQIIDAIKLNSITGQSVFLPDSSKLIHLQFRRFAGCPVCNLHIQSFKEGNTELETKGIKELVVFHSTEKALLSHQVDMPFPVIADPKKSLYKAFGVEASMMSILHPKAWWPMMRGMFHHFGLPGWGETMFGLPADFLIDRTGRILAFKYGRHANDHWSVADVIALSGAGNSQE